MIVPAPGGINENLQRKEPAVKRTILLACACLLVLAALALLRIEQPRTLDIYFLDMVGGASTLIVTPLGESVLIDTGSLRPEHRDADRILRACTEAGLKQIDYLVTTHFHSDHFGAILEVAQRIPVKCFIDKGTRAPAEDGDNRWSKELYTLYDQATQGNTRTIRAGDDIPLRNDPTGKLPKLRLHCVAAEKKVEGFDGDIDAPIDATEMRPPDHTDNARSIALLLTYGRFKFFAGGDITWNVEFHLVCPTNRIGILDLYQVTHHGLDQSNNSIFLARTRPAVCVAMNGPRKGVMPETFNNIMQPWGRQVLYQLHYNTQYGDRLNAKPEFIANPKENPDQGEFIKAAVRAEEGIFTVQIGRKGRKTTYPIQPAAPDIGKCTRVEVRYFPSTLEHFFGNAKDQVLLNGQEKEYLQSLKTLVVEDAARIQTLASVLSRGTYNGPHGIVSAMPAAAVYCYRKNTCLLSFAVFGHGIATHDRHRFEYLGESYLGWRGPLMHNVLELTPELLPFALRKTCAGNLQRLRREIQATDSPTDAYPSPGQWCDEVVRRYQRRYSREYAKRDFKCPALDDGACHYAMNSHCTKDSPADVVLLFETKAGWNQHGGSELFTVDNHNPEGGCVLLKDGTVRFVRTGEEVKQLRWK